MQHLLWNEPLDVHSYAFVNLSAYLLHPRPEFLDQAGEGSLLKRGSSGLNIMNRGKAPFTLEIQTLREIRGPETERSIKTIEGIIFDA